MGLCVILQCMGLCVIFQCMGPCVISSGHGAVGHLIRARGCWSPAWAQNCCRLCKHTAVQHYEVQHPVKNPSHQLRAVTILKGIWGVVKRVCCRLEPAVNILTADEAYMFLCIVLSTSSLWYDFMLDEDGQNP